MHRFLELFTLAAFVTAMGHAVVRHGRLVGGSLVVSTLWLGLVRETLVVLERVLYGFAPLSLRLGTTPLIAAIIWGFSIHAASVFAETMTGERLVDLRPSDRFYGWMALFMVALAGFFEPFLALVELARWEEGTRTVLGVPWVALLGYPTMAVLYLFVFCATLRRVRGPRLAFSMAIRLAFAALLHVQTLTALKRAFGW